MANFNTQASRLLTQFKRAASAATKARIVKNSNGLLFVQGDYLRVDLEQVPDSTHEPVLLTALEKRVILEDR